MKTILVSCFVFLLCISAISVKAQRLNPNVPGPTILQPDSINTTSFVMRWRSAPLGDAGILCDIASDSNFTNILTKDIFIPTIYPCLSVFPNRYRIKVPTSNAYYRIRQGLVYRGFSPLPAETTNYSSTAQITLSRAAPPVPPSIQPVQNITHNGFQVFWSQALGLTFNYRLEAATDSNFTQNVVSRQIMSDTSAYLTNLLSATTYFLRVTANGFGSSSSAIIKERTSDLPSPFTVNSIVSNKLGFYTPASANMYYWYNLNRILTIDTVNMILDTLLKRNIQIDAAWFQNTFSCGTDSIVESRLLIKPTNANLTIPNFEPQFNRVLWKYCGCLYNREYILTTKTSINIDITPPILEILPNPANDIANISITLPFPTSLRFTLHDVLGRELYDIANSVYPAGRQEVPLSLNELPLGIYFVRSNIGGQVVVRRLAVVR